MTRNTPNFSRIPFSRNVNRAAIVDSKKLRKHTTGPNSLPKGPVLVLPVDVPLVDITPIFGITAIEGCDMLFFDVVASGQYFCNVASAGDREVMSAMSHWDKTGVMPIWLKTKAGPCGLIRDDFSLHQAYQTAFAASAHQDYLNQLLDRFHRLLEPTMMEGLVAARTGLKFHHVHVGFLATSQTEPGLPAVQ
ncbi:MAG: hypothetical protein KG075_22225 [Alphaproteobacteria bacterium]|nr:hypothetical protein [Alphaproteobacteria bacterium]